MPKYSLPLLIIITVSVLFPPVTMARQESIRHNHFSDDSLYLYARDLAFAGELEKALDAATCLLNRNPGYADANVLIARIFAWEEKYDSSRAYIDKVISVDSCYHDALSALTDIEIWEGNYKSAVETAIKALVCHPDDELFLLKKSKAHYHDGNLKEAGETLDYLLGVNPDNEDARELEKLMSAPGYYHYRESNYLLGGYHGEFIEEPFSRHMHIGTAGYSYYTRHGPLTGKLNFANTYIDGTGMTRYPSLQYEADYYPELSPEGYLFINYAYSAGTIFPRHRGAFEIFRKLPQSFEASLGMRFLHWDETYMFYTGSLGKYYADLWFSLRTYILPGDEGVSASWYFNARKYFSTADDYAGIIIGFGLSPDETLADLTDRVYLKSTSIGGELSKGIGSDYLIKSSLRYGREEYQDSSYRGRWIFNFELRYYL